jgi:cyclic di-GMP phosphodiesterase Gmr
MESFDEPGEKPIPPPPDNGQVEIRGSLAPSADCLHLVHLLEKAQAGENEARQGLAILHEIVNLLPVGVTLQAENGNFLFANDAASAQFAPPAQALIEASPSSHSISQEPKPQEPMSQETARRRLRAVALIGEGASVTTEERLVNRLGERTLLTTHSPVRIRDETLLLSTSLDITDRKQAEEELSRRAYFDELTRLPNRCLIQEHVERVLASSDGRFALAFLDIDDFKHINDYYSHAIGDALLAKVAQRIATNIRASDMLARISGDEFLLLLDPLESEAGLAVIVNHLLDLLKEPFYIEGFEIFTSASIGVSVYPEHGRDYETLSRNADSAMYQVKSGTKGGAAIFDLEIDQAVSARTELEQRLRLAVRDCRFRCAFQPKVDIHTQEVVGVEALIRLLDEDGVIQAPSSFVGLAVELGLIDDLTHLVLSQTVESLDLLNDAFGSQASISINVAAKQASDVDFMRSFVETLKGTDCAERFMVEVTEDAFIAKSRFQMQVLPMLRAIGVRVSIDDFGTGYSSLSALADITADEIKIDRSFITDIHERGRSQSVLKAIESLGNALGMTVIAEGVETPEELAYLRTMTGIRYAQGYYFAKPMFFEEFSPLKRVASESRLATGFRDLPEKRRMHSRSR